MSARARLTLLTVGLAVTLCISAVAGAAAIAPTSPAARSTAAYPSRASIAAAVRYLDARAGRTSLAVVDTAGRLSGTRTHVHFQSASVVKVMFLTAFLQRL
ncbi:MAG: hypothetical protein ACYDHT_12970, partial [Solirubrobacteraceae bacterium]